MRTRSLLPLALVLVLSCVVVDSRAESEPTEPSPPAATERAPDYACYLGGFCGQSGWASGVYANDTKESTGCGLTPEDSAQWDNGVADTPLLPAFARPHCTFFYSFQTCSVPTIACRS